MKPIISVKEARKLLGTKYETQTDEEIVELIGQTHEMAILALDVARNKVANEKNNYETNEAIY